MTTRSNTIPVYRTFTWSLAFVIMTTLASNALIFGVAHALPPDVTCKITTYYSNAAKTQEIGTFSTCPGKNRGLTGKKSKYFDVETLDRGDSRPGHSEPGGLPCEFQAEGCSGIPSPR